MTGSAALALSVINQMYCNCTGICQIQLVRNLAGDGFGQIQDLPEPKSGTSLPKILANCQLHTSLCIGNIYYNWHILGNEATDD